ncbi:MAG: DNA repair protein RecN [Holophagaceae bacterium]|nr:DNA repair protein RecN [Holophagaceae bacterium]
MLCSLLIKNLALVEDLSLDFQGGVTVLTGETGAGKSLLVDALALLLGARGDSEFVRAGADRATVEAVIDGNFEKWNMMLKDRGLPVEQPIILRREVSCNGRSRAWMNGSPVALADLRDAGRIWIRLTSQHDHQSLLRDERHLGLFDEIIGIQADLSIEADAVQKAETRLKSRKESEANRESRLEDLAEILGNLEKFSPKPHEWTQLKAEREPLRHSTHLEEAWRESAEAFRKARPFLEAAQRALSRTATILPDMQFEQDRMRSMMLELDDLHTKSEDEFIKWSAQGANRLEEVENRLARYERFARRLHCEPDELSEKYAQLINERTALMDGEESIAELEKALKTATNAYCSAAEALQSQRQGHVLPLEKKIHHRLAQLGMPGARLQIRIGFAEDSKSPAILNGRGIRVSKRGATDLTFWIEPNVGEGFRPLEKIASGGELSRIMLSMMGAGKGVGEGLTLVLDEVDAGLGGEAALAVGESIQDLGKNHQVLAVTHLAQVAARADHHGVLSKETLVGRTRASLTWVEGEQRVRELARLLSGHPEGMAAQAHAKSLLELSNR